MKSIFMKKLLYFSVALLPFVLASCGGKAKRNEADKAAGERPEPVETLTLDVQSVARDIEYTATMLAWEEVHYAPAAPGRIDQILVDVGQQVQKGQLLVQMDQTQYHQALVQLKTLETDFARMDTLHKAGTIAQQQYDQVKSQLEVLRSNVAFLAENVRLTAPFSGVVSGKYFQPGEMYSGAPAAPIGKAAILSLVQIDRLKLLVPISERYFPLISKGMEATVRCDIYPDKTFIGKVFNVYPVIDPLSRTFNIEISVDNRERLLRPGMFSRVSLDLDKEQALLLPANAILKLQGSNDRYLFIEVNGVAKRIPVTIGKRINDLVEVNSSVLKAGDHLIVKGQGRLLDGMKVEVVKNHNEQ